MFRRPTGESQLQVRGFNKQVIAGLVCGLACLSDYAIASGLAGMWGYSSHTVRRPNFRPVAHWTGWQRQAPVWRYRLADVAQKRVAFSPTTQSRRQFAEPGVTTRWPRKAVAISRGQDLGSKFRPDERLGSGGYEVLMPSTGEVVSPEPDLQSRFRPIEKRRKRYEETEAGRESQRQLQLPPPLMPYPALPMPASPYNPGFWPNW